MVGANGLGLPMLLEMSLTIPCRNARLVPPMYGLPDVKAKLYVMQANSTVMRQVMAKLVITVSPTFFLRTMPPVEEAETRHRHHQHQRHGGEHPASIAGIGRT